jgi:hypothetical protein
MIALFVMHAAGYDILTAFSMKGDNHAAEKTFFTVLSTIWF